MSGGKQLKYVRTTQGFMIFPCLVTTHKSAAGSSGWPILSAGLVDWDHDGRPLCMGASETLGIASLPEDTEALRAEWGMQKPSELLAAARPLVAMTFDEGRAAEDKGQRLLYCQHDNLNPCWPQAWSKEFGPGKHWGGGDACPECNLRAAIAKTAGSAA